MELWIRSQDKELLLKVDLISTDAVIEEDEQYDVRFHNIILGRYESKKRALEILDEIQQALLDNDIPYTGAVISFNNKIVYEMPEE